MVANCPIAKQAQIQPNKWAVLNKDICLSYQQLNEAIHAKTEQLFQNKDSIINREALPTIETLLYLWAALRLNKCVYLFNPKQPINSQDSISFLKTIDYQNGNTSFFNKAATILATSGSSGEAKYVVHSLANHYSAYQNLSIPFSNKDHWACLLPLHHIAAVSIVMRCAFAGATLVLGTHYKELDWHSFPCSLLSLVATQLNHYLKKPHPDNPKLILGGSPISKALLDAAAETQQLYLSYGSTETAAQICAKKYDGKTLSVGKTHLEYKISKNGELSLRGPQCFLGYLQDNGKIKQMLNSDGYFPTGDIAAENGDGELFIKGRLDNMFISGGENVFPESIEKAFSEFFNLEKAICIPIQDEHYGQRACLFYKSKVPISDSEFLSYSKNNLLPYQRPILFYEMPVLSLPDKQHRKYLKEHWKHFAGHL